MYKIKLLYLKYADFFTALDLFCEQGNSFFTDTPYPTQRKILQNLTSFHYHGFSGTVRQAI